MGVEHLHVLGPHAVPAQVDERPRQHLEIGFGADGAGFGDAGVER